MYYSRPLLVNRYPVYMADIAPTGLDVIEIDGAITPEVVRGVTRRLGDADRCANAAERNYDICLERFSYQTVRNRLLPLLA